ncbi:MAG: hypothetical protein B6I33_00985 [Propionibacterium sp. 4572_24]|nr:MAG: hypothetical protein B6I33_00985 [Propionibacterium sp. 4572_24]
MEAGQYRMTADKSTVFTGSSTASERWCSAVCDARHTRARGSEGSDVTLRFPDLRDREVGTNDEFAPHAGTLWAYRTPTSGNLGRGRDE